MWQGVVFVSVLQNYFPAAACCTLKTELDSILRAETNSCHPVVMIHDSAGQLKYKLIKPAVTNTRAWLSLVLKTFQFAKNHTRGQLYIPLYSLKHKDEYILVIKHKTFLSRNLTILVTPQTISTFRP